MHMCDRAHNANLYCNVVRSKSVAKGHLLSANTRFFQTFVVVLLIGVIKIKQLRYICNVMHVIYLDNINTYTDCDLDS